MSRVSRPRCRRLASFKSAFTLIEMLVVISIISLLISLLLPALRAARDTAKTIACLSGQRTLAQMFLIYVNDYDNRFPTWEMRIPTQTARVRWSQGMAHYMGFPRAKDRFVCPNKPWQGRSSEGWEYLDYGYNWFNIGSHYWESGNVNSAPARVGEVVTPSKTYLLIDCYFQPLPDRGFTLVWDWADPTFLGQVELRHGQGWSLNAVYADGHGATVAAADPDHPYEGDVTDRYDDPNAWTLDSRPR